MLQLVVVMSVACTTMTNATPIDSIGLQNSMVDTSDSTIPSNPRANSVLIEDCIEIDLETVKVAQIKNRYKIIDGEKRNHFLLDFGKKRRIAYQVLNVLTQYKTNQACFIGRPGPSFTYILKDGAVPEGYIRGEKCAEFDPTDLHIVEKNGFFKLFEKEALINFSIHEDEALKALITIKNYGFTNVCKVGKGTTTFSYMK